MTDRAEGAEASLPLGRHTANGRKARYGVSYVRSICAQAGVGPDETSPDEDVNAVDCDVVFREANVRVQVTCTSQFPIVAGRGRGTVGWPSEEGWIRRWDDSLLPVYFVMVLAPADVDTWIDHPTSRTIHGSVAVQGELSPRVLPFTRGAWWFGAAD